jgi:hypothetical protein
LIYPAFAQAKTGISVGRFADKTEKSRCPGLTRKAKADLDMKLQNQLIAGLMQLKRFQIREREVRSLRPEHSIIGSVRAFEVCAGQGRGQVARIELEVQMLSAKGDLTHMFSSSASTSSAADNLAPQMAMNSAINELIRRIDDAVPRKGALRLTSKRGLSSSPMIVKLVPRDRR